MGSFLDTSALAKLYHPEAGTLFVERLVLRQNASPFVSRLGVLEMHSVLAVKVRTGAMTPAELAVVRRRFKSDLRKRQFRVVALSAEHYRDAEALIRTHGAARGLRTLDSLQLAVALDLYRKDLIDDFVVADMVLCQVAAAEGLKPVDPEAAVM